MCEKVKVDKKYGVIKLHDKYYKSYAVFIKDEFYKPEEIKSLASDCKTEKARSEKIFDLYVPNENDVKKNENIQEEYNNYKKFIVGEKQINECKIYKYRPYLKVIKSNIDEGIEKFDDKILTFVLFNPSTANQYKLDPTIENCAYLTFKKDYNGFEILNLFNIRDPKTDLILNSYKGIGKIDNCKRTNNFDFKYNNAIIGKEIILAWGYDKAKYRSLMFKVMEKQWESLKTQFKQDSKYMVLKITQSTDNNIPWHFGNQSWNSKGLPFKKHIEKDIQLIGIENTDPKICENGEIK